MSQYCAFGTLNADVFHYICEEWITFLDLISLDKAMCQHETRKQYFDLLRTKQLLVSVREASTLCQRLKDKFGGIDSQVHSWFLQRNLSLRDVHLERISPSGLWEYFPSAASVTFYDDNLLQKRYGHTTDLSQVVVDSLLNLPRLKSVTVAIHSNISHVSIAEVLRAVESCCATSVASLSISLNWQYWSTIVPALPTLLGRLHTLHIARLTPEFFFPAFLSTKCVFPLLEQLTFEESALFPEHTNDSDDDDGDMLADVEDSLASTRFIRLPRLHTVEMFQRYGDDATLSAVLRLFIPLAPNLRQFNVHRGSNYFLPSTTDGEENWTHAEAEKRYLQQDIRALHRLAAAQMVETIKLDIDAKRQPWPSHLLTSPATPAPYIYAFEDDSCYEPVTVRGQSSLVWAVVAPLSLCHSLQHLHIDYRRGDHTMPVDAVYLAHLLHTIVPQAFPYLRSLRVACCIETVPQLLLVPVDCHRVEMNQQLAENRSDTDEESPSNGSFGSSFGSSQLASVSALEGHRLKHLDDVVLHNVLPMLPGFRFPASPSAQSGIVLSAIVDLAFLLSLPSLRTLHVRHQLNLLSSSEAQDAVPVVTCNAVLRDDETNNSESAGDGDQKIALTVRDLYPFANQLLSAFRSSIAVKGCSSLRTLRLDGYLVCDRVLCALFTALSASITSRLEHLQLNLTRDNFIVPESVLKAHGPEGANNCRGQSVAQVAVHRLGIHDASFTYASIQHLLWLSPSYSAVSPSASSSASSSSSTSSKSNLRTLSIPFWQNWTVPQVLDTILQLHAHFPSLRHLTLRASKTPATVSADSMWHVVAERQRLLRDELLPGLLSQVPGMRDSDVEEVDGAGRRGQGRKKYATAVHLTLHRRLHIQITTYLPL